MFSFTLKLLIRFYQLAISPFLAPSCRFVPSCSAYAIDGINQQGIKAIPTVIKRICRCHPWGQSGYDPFSHPSFDCSSHSELNGITNKTNFYQNQTLSKANQSQNNDQPHSNRSSIYG